MGDIVTLNIGGTKFQTYEGTVTNVDVSRKPLTE